MYTAKYLIYGYWLLTVASLMYNVKQYYNVSTKNRPTIINLIWCDSSKELYGILKLAGITPDQKQKDIIENEIKNKYSHKTLGFKKG